MAKITRTEQTEMEGEDAYYLSNMQIGADYEVFTLELISGTNKRLYLTSPSHAKRIAALLTQYVQLYEKEFGEIQTSPQSQSETGASSRSIGFAEESAS